MVSFYVSLLFQLPCFEGRKVIPLTRMSTGGVMETRHTAAVQVLVYTTTVARSLLVHTLFLCVRSTDCYCPPVLSNYGTRTLTLL